MSVGWLGKEKDALQVNTFWLRLLNWQTANWVTWEICLSFSRFGFLKRKMEIIVPFYGVGVTTK